jgi:NTP pyrophosphatase (non-canonical NTP hydrolase)
VNAKTEMPESAPEIGPEPGSELPSDLTIRAYQERVDRWVRTVGVRYFSELTNLAQLAEEVGEVARLLSRTHGDQSFKPDETRGDLADELADVLFVVVCLANQTGIDLTEALVRNLEKKTRRDRDRHRDNPKLREGRTGSTSAGVAETPPGHSTRGSNP